MINFENFGTGGEIGTVSGRLGHQGCHALGLVSPEIPLAVEGTGEIGFELFIHLIDNLVIDQVAEHHRTIEITPG